MRRGLTFVTFFYLSLSFVEPARGAIYAEIPGIPGDVTTVGHADEVALSSLAFSGGQVERKTGPRLCAGPASKTQVSPMTLQKTTDIASAKLLAAAAAGTVFDVVRITVVKTADVDPPADLVRYELKGAFIYAYDVASSGDRPTESLTLQFKSLELTTFDQSETPEPPQTATWNFCGVP